MFGWTARLLATMAITLRATVRNDQPDLGPAASAAGSPACRLHRARSGKSAKASTMVRLVRCSREMKEKSEWYSEF